MPAILDLDTLLFTALNASADSPEWVVPFAKFATQVIPSAAILSVIVLVLIPNRTNQFGAIRVLMSMAIAWSLARGLQGIIPMPRPFTLGIGTLWIAHAPNPSFPSSHASVALAFGVSCMLSFKNRLIQFAAVLTAGLVAWSRVCLGVHFPSDVAAGLVVASMSSLTVHKLTSPALWQGIRAKLQSKISLSQDFFWR